MGWWEHCVSDTRRMLKESKVTAGICRPVEAEYGLWPSLSKLHKAASLSAADSDSALVATSWVASAVRCLQDFQLTLPRGVRVRVFGGRPPTELGGWLTRTVSTNHIDANCILRKHVQKIPYGRWIVFITERSPVSRFHHFGHFQLCSWRKNALR